MAQANTYDDRLLEEIGQDVLADCRSALMVRFRFLDLALWKMPFVPAAIDAPLATDGKQVSFEPLQTLLRYRLTPYELIRDLLHSILHCIFRHPFEESGRVSQAWELACDITVESIALEMCESSFRSDFDGVRKQALSILEKACGSLSPNRLYRMFKKVIESGAVELPNAENVRASTRHSGVSHAPTMSFDAPADDTIESAVTNFGKSVKQLGRSGFLTVSDLFVLQQLFARDSHCAWASNQKDNKSKKGDSKNDDSAKKLESPDEGQQNNDAAQQGNAQAQNDQPDNDMPNASEEDIAEGQNHDAKQQPDANTEQNEHSENGMDKESRLEEKDDNWQQAARKPDDEQQMSKEDWEEIARQVELDLEAHSRGQGDETSNLRVLLPVANRTKYNYSDFLRKFAIVSEEIKVNEEEFDYIYYTYGLNEYGNRPFVEPLEYQDTNRIRDFVIALDTSGSCSGELVRSFVEETFRILKEGQSFASHVNVHIIQCDNRIQNDQVITSKRELDRYLDEFEVRGFGGTDFRPVFEYVDQLVADEQFDDLRGLIYFTDGMGTYPKNMPSYDVAFVFMSEDMVNPNVPPWAMKVVLDEDEVRELGQS